MYSSWFFKIAYNIWFFKKCTTFGSLKSVQHLVLWKCTSFGYFKKVYSIWFCEIVHGIWFFKKSVQQFVPAVVNVQIILNNSICNQTLIIHVKITKCMYGNTYLYGGEFLYWLFCFKRLQRGFGIFFFIFFFYKWLCSLFHSSPINSYFKLQLCPLGL